MKQHIVPSIVASVVACAAAWGFLHFAEPKYRVSVANAPVGAISPAKAARLAKTVWPELTQAEVDGLTVKLKDKPGEVTIFCLDDAKCGDLVLSLDNAFESAHWKTTLANSQMVPPGVISSSADPGVISSSADLVLVLNSSTGLTVKLDRENKNAGPGEYIAIGARP